MSAVFHCKTTGRWCVLLLTFVSLTLASKIGVVVKRDTTLDNVKAMYNRFISPSTGKAKYVTQEKDACSLKSDREQPSIINTPGMIPVAASKDDFQSSLGCGVCLKIEGSAKAAAADLEGSPPVEGTLKGIVVDQDDSISQGDLALLPPQSGSGLWEIKFKAVDCPTGDGPTGTIQFRFMGSNDYYFQVQALNARIPVAGIEAFERVKGKYFCLTRTPENFFTSEGMGPVSFPLKVRLTSIMNEQLEAVVNALKNNVIIPSDIQFSESKIRGGSPDGIQCYGQGERPPSGDSQESFCVGKENGIYADPNDATAFYACDDQKTTKKFCPPGLKFNPVISMCDVPQDVRYTGNDVDSFEYQVHPKGKPRWTSLPGTKGLKILSFGSPEETKISPKVKPHKLLSINIFHSPHLIQKASFGNVSHGEASDSMARTNMSQSAVTGGNIFEGSMNTLNRTMSFNPLATTAGGKLNQPTRAGDLQHYTNQSKIGFQMSSQSRPNAYQGHVTTEAVRPRFQNNQISSQAGKILAINVYGLNPVEPDSRDGNHNSNEYNKNLEPANLQKDASLSDQGSNNVVSNTPTTGRSNQSAFQQQSQKISLGRGPFQDDIAVAKEATFTPLKFKLKVHMDKGNAQPTFNCTLSECSENGFAMDGETKGKGTLQSSQAVPFSGTREKPTNNQVLKGLKGSEEVQITLSTVGSEPMSNVGKYEVKSQQSEQVGKINRGQSEMKNETHNIIHQANSLVSEKTNRLLSQQFDDMGKKSVSQGKELNITDQKINAPSNVQPAIGQQENKSTLETKAVKTQENSKHQASTNQTLDRQGFPGTEANDNSGKKLKVNKDGYQEFGPVGEVIGTSQVSTENDSQAKMKEEAKKVSESTVLADFNHPQLRIILKSPGKISSILNGSHLKRRLNKKRRWDQIIKSLIERPLKTGGRSKDVLAKLSKLMKKSLEDSREDKIGHANMPSSIAESILEANKEYLDDIAMQGMIYSDGDPETENINDIANTIKHGYNYLHTVPEFPQWDKPKQAEKRVHGEHKASQKSFQINQEKVVESSGKGENNSTLPILSKNDKHESSESGGKVDAKIEDEKRHGTGTVLQQHTADVNAYKEGILKTMIDPSLKSFCIGKESGTYSSPSGQKSYLFCVNGITEQRECPKKTLFNPKEKICDLPDNFFKRKSPV